MGFFLCFINNYQNINLHKGKGKNKTDFSFIKHINRTKKKEKKRCGNFFNLD